MKTFVLVYTLSFLNLFQVFAQEMGDCNFNRGLKNQEEYKIELKNYLDCLVQNNLQNKNKAQLLEDLRDAVICSKFANTMMMYSKNYINYQSLLHLSSIADLEEMVNSNIAEWRYYGFWALAEKQETDVFATLKRLMKDKTPIRAKMGCVPEENTLSHYCIQLVTEKYKFKEENYKSEIYQLTLEEKAELDKLLNTK